MMPVAVQPELKVGARGPPTEAGSTAMDAGRDDGLSTGRAAGPGALRYAQDSSSIGNGVGSQYFSSFMARAEPSSYL